MRHRRGFTLIELIVALAIVALLAAIAIPVYTAVQTQATQKADVAAANTLAQAISAYYAVNGCLPTPTQSWGGMPTALAPYYGTTSAPSTLLYITTASANLGGIWVLGGGTAQSVAVQVSPTSTTANVIATVYIWNGINVPMC